MDYLPIFLDIRGRRCVVVGGGTVAQRKVELLLRAGASVDVIAPTLTSALGAWASEGRVRFTQGGYEPGHLANAALVFATSDDANVNAAIAAEAAALHVPVNVVDMPVHCTFIMPAIVDRSPVIVAVSSGGRAPVLARMLKALLERALSHRLGVLAELAGEMRELVKARLKDPHSRMRFWERVFTGPLLANARDISREDARGAMARDLDTAVSAQDTPGLEGWVSLVGAGPGDPELLTLRAARLLQEADVVVHDRLVSQEVLELARRDAERIPVGKSKGRCVLPQEEINKLLIRLAREGKRVVRLKGGDPFIFGRGGEELDALRAAGVSCEMVPGITAAAGCAARFGIPLTHRGIAHSVALATGHPQKDGDLSLPHVAHGQTLAIYMGMSRLRDLCTALIQRGLASGTPCALIQDGTTATERAVTGSLDSIATQAEVARIRAPALLIVGEVVRLGRIASAEHRARDAFGVTQPDNLVSAPRWNRSSPSLPSAVS